MRIVHILVPLFFLLIITHSSNNSNKQRIKYFTHSFNRFISDDNFTSIIKNDVLNNDKNNLIGILFTNKNCQTCIQSQIQMINILNKMEQQIQIPIFRCQLATNMKLAQKFKIKRFPMIHFIIKLPKKRLQIYKTSLILTEKNILQLGKHLKLVINYLFQPINSNKLLYDNYQNLPKTNKIIVNFEKLSKEYKITNKNQFIQNYVLDELFNTIPIILLDNLNFQMYKQINNIHKRKKTNKQSQKLIIISVLINQKQQYLHFPIQSIDINQFPLNEYGFQFLFKSFLFYTVNQFTEDYYKIYQTLKNLKLKDFYSQCVIYLQILDSIWQRQQSQKYIYLSNKIIGNFEKQILIFWTQGQINKEKKKLLGFKQNAMSPLFGKLNLKIANQSLPLIDKSTNKPIFNFEAIKKFINTDLGYEQLLFTKILVQIQLLNLKNQIKIIKSSQLKLQQKKDVFIFIYCTSRLITDNNFLQLSNILKRFQKFYTKVQMIILADTCKINKQNKIQQGLSLFFNSDTQFLGKQILTCKHFQKEILSITKNMTQKMQIFQFIPQNFCIPQKQMFQYLHQIAI